MQKMKLKEFQILNFRSIIDSGWISIANITTLVGVNESGKSNVLLALWKFNPARGGEIEIHEDVPFSFSEDSLDENEFINCKFEINEIELNKQIIDFFKLYSNLETTFAKIPNSKVKNDDKNLGKEYEKPINAILEISKHYNGKYSILKFDNLLNLEKISNEFKHHLKLCCDYFSESTDIVDRIHEWTVNNPISKFNYISQDFLLFLNSFLTFLKELEIELLENNRYSKNSSKEVNEFINWLGKNSDEIKKYFSLRKTIIESIPKFIYYSHYDSIPSTIVLSETAKRIDEKKEFNNKINTIEILFKYLKLKIHDIKNLGLFTSDDNISQSKKIDQRTKKLKRSSIEFSKEFNKWWSQAKYKFNFKADGDYFKIWVSKEEYEHDVNLKNRSIGFQWFLSFYLIFSVGEIESSSGIIILLDEAGLSLHSQGQKDLVNFLNDISNKSQILYTTHSPFLIDTKNLENSKLVYLDENFNTVISDNLRANTNNPISKNAIHAIHAALELETFDILFQNPNSIIIEGLSDQYYFNAIESYLVKHDLINDEIELSFLPSNGIDRMQIIITAFLSKGIIPKIVLDSDEAGSKFREKILKRDYSDDANKIIFMEEITGKEKAETEDMFPIELFKESLKVIFPNTEIEKIIFDEKKPFIKQLNEYFEKNNINSGNYYKVRLAKQIKKHLENYTKRVDKNFETIWVDFFNKLSK